MSIGVLEATSDTKNLSILNLQSQQVLSI